ncbi:hypothetical protein BDC45DRAFT_231264 [Circinella umbellata]|nr:hypothetical protein BDC45DRAFT_231264 [Circinella umbellata]
MDHRKTKSLKLAYQRRITTFLTYDLRNKKLRSLHHHCQRSLIQAQEDLRISKELKERLPPRWYFLSRSGKKKNLITRVNQNGRLDIKNIHDKKFMQEYNHSEQIRKELKNPYIRQLFFYLTDLAVKKLYWVPYSNPELWKNETEYFKEKLFGIYHILVLYWIPYLETKLIPDIKEQWKEDRRKWIKRLIGILPTSSSRTRRLYIEHDDDTVAK